MEQSCISLSMEWKMQVRISVKKNTCKEMGIADKSFIGTE